MATAPNTNINIPYSEFLNQTTGRPNQEWLLWLMNPSFISINIGSALPVTSGGTGLTTIPTAGQLLIGNGTGYTLNPLTPGAGIGVTNGVGAITVANTGVLSWAGGSTGLTPSGATTGAVTLAGTLGAGYGGTGLNTYVIGDLLYSSGTTALSRLADVATGNALISGGVAVAPSWGKIGLTTHVSGTLPIGNGGTNGTATATAGAIAYGTGSAYAFTAAGTSGQVLTSAAAGTPTWTTPTTGTVTAVSVVSANGLAGTSSGGATPALTLSTTVTGVVKGNGTALSAATAATDYVAPSAYASANGLTMATARLLGRTTASTGAAEEISVAGGLTLSGGTLTGTSGTVTAVSVVSANGLAGSSSGGATPALTLSTTITGLLKGNGTAISAATSGTDYAPATSGTSILYGNGSGGFNNVTIGTGVSFAAGTLSATGSGGTVTSVTGTAPVVSSGGTTPAISMAAATTSVNGYLTSTDWNTFNSKGSGSVTSVAQSFTGGLISVAGSPITTSGTLALTVAGTSGGIPYFSSGTTWATSAALAAGSLVQGGGAGVAPSTITTGTGVVTALGVNTGTAGAFVVNGNGLGTPSSGTVTNLTGTASININGTVGATTAAAGKFTTLGVTALITSTLTSGEVMKFGSPSAGTGIIYMDMFNTSGGLYLGIEGSAGGSLWTNIPAYATGLGGRNGGGGISFSANAVTQHMLLTTTGLSVTGTLGVSTGAAVGGATPGAGGLAFPATAVAVADANTLDDYEEGTWTPTQGAGLTVVGTFSSLGRYTKIGDTVFIEGKIAATTSLSFSSGVVCGGLPFTASSTFEAMFAGANQSSTATAIVASAGTSLYAQSSLAATTAYWFSGTYKLT